MNIAAEAQPKTAQTWRGTIARRTAGAGAWVAQARCRGTDPTLFFLGSDDDAGAARAICAQCPVREACLEYAVVAREELGIWGGKTALERRSMLRRRRRARSA